MTTKLTLKFLTTADVDLATLYPKATFPVLGGNMTVTAMSRLYGDRHEKDVVRVESMSVTANGIECKADVSMLWDTTFKQWHLQTAYSLIRRAAVNSILNNPTPGARDRVIEAAREVAKRFDDEVADWRATRDLLDTAILYRRAVGQAIDHEKQAKARRDEAADLFDLLKKKVQ